jgi:hypothetical protein
MGRQGSNKALQPALGVMNKGNMDTKILRLLLPLFIAGCSQALPRLSYDQPVMNRTDNSAVVDVVTRQGTGLVPLTPGGPWVELARVQFNPEDQTLFAEYLRAELNRLGLLRVMPGSPDAKPDVRILLTFTNSHLRSAFYEHTLGVTLNISSGGKTFERAYEIDSHENETPGKKWNTSGKEGKTLAARKLMAKLIPDIDAFLGRGASQER